jgi:UDP-N-acetylmuramate dehydrogenase
MDKNELVTIIHYLNDRLCPFIIIGRGSNIIFNDEGYRGAVINLESCLSQIGFENGNVRVGAGVWLSRFVDFCIQNELAGVEMLSGIPGTLGGAVVMNAGAYGGEISNCLIEVEIIREGNLKILKMEECGFSYRKSGFINDVIVSALFSMKKGNKNELAERRRELIIKRNASQPLEYPNSGSIFRNPKPQVAAKLIEECGLKGKTIGKAQVSEKHANFIINLGGASASEIRQLIDLVQRTVHHRMGILLEPEVKLLGFVEVPLKN